VLEQRLKHGPGWCRRFWWAAAKVKGYTGWVPIRNSMFQACIMEDFAMSNLELFAPPQCIRLLLLPPLQPLKSRRHGRLLVLWWSHRIRHLQTTL